MATTEIEAFALRRCTWVGVLWYVALVNFYWIFLFWLIAIVFMYTSIICLTVITISVGIVLMELFLKFVRGAAWRIAEYNKGAFAAILLLLTVFLGVIDVYLRLQK